MTTDPATSTDPPAAPSRAHTTATDAPDTGSTPTNPSGTGSPSAHSTGTHSFGKNCTGTDSTGEHASGGHASGAHSIGADSTGTHTGADSTDARSIGTASTSAESTGTDTSGTGSSGARSISTDSTGTGSSGAHSSGTGSTGADGGGAGTARLVPGLLLTLAVAVAATAAGTVAPVVGAPVVAIVLGAGARAALGRRPYWGRVRPGAAFAGRYVLQAAVVVFGLGLSLGAVARVGLSSLPVMLGTLAVCLLGAWVVGRALRVERDLRVLIGAGTGICGASAIGAVSPVIAASEATVAYAVSTIFLYNVAAALLFPPLGHLLGLGDHGFGLWAGTAVNDTSSVVAAGFAYSQAAGNYAVVVKLVRSLMIVPVVIGVSVLARRRGGATGTRKPVWRLVPVFLWLFLLAALANTVGLVPHAAHAALGTVATFLVAVALAGVGTGISFGELRRAGARPLVAGGILWVLVALTSLGIQALTGTV
ncbi:YeiH family protein [Actinocatenispora rupis]|uniref:Sulfate exporter family transporter n=1 Tax=Actinocatenispora rupis TaxID=519421 RepID=A0A8J3J350_9ACTN|nr:putative sulfate exporter family transporter [Actinocatenispora rupis]GID13740.1 hypothetical protein Aru02nite_46290 [Actinocatenispora rupis]